MQKFNALFFFSFIGWCFYPLFAAEQRPTFIEKTSYATMNMLRMAEIVFGAWTLALQQDLPSLNIV